MEKAVKVKIKAIPCCIFLAISRELRRKGIQREGKEGVTLLTFLSLSRICWSSAQPGHVMCCLVDITGGEEEISFRVYR